MRLKLKRHFKLLVALALILAVLALGFGDRPIVAYTVDDGGLLDAVTAGQAAGGDTATAGSVALSGDGAAGSATVPISGAR